MSNRTVGGYLEILGRDKGEEHMVMTSSSTAKKGGEARCVGGAKKK